MHSTQDQDSEITQRRRPALASMVLTLELLVIKSSLTDTSRVRGPAKLPLLANKLADVKYEKIHNVLNTYSIFNI